MAAGKQAFGLKNIFASILETTAKMALEISNFSRELGAATGFGDQFNNEIARIAQKGNMANIGFKESADALRALTDNVSSFNPAAEETNEHMGLTVARLAKLGVSSTQSAQAMDFMQRTMKMTGKMAADATAQIARMGKAIGVTGAKMIEQFNKASERLAIYGNKNIKVFKELAAQAKAAGLEMGTLLSVSKNFDKFDTAAESVGKLNAVLGTQLSTLEMLNATDSERVMLIKKEVQASVGNFDSLDKYTKMYIAQAMGVETVDKAQKLLNMSTAEYETYQKGQQEAADIQKEMAEATEEVVPLMQQLKLAAMQVFLAFKPIITVVGGLINGISWLIGLFTQLIPQTDFANKTFDVLTGTLMIAAAAFAIFGKAVMLSLGPIGWLVAGLTALFAAFHLKGSPELWELPEHSGAGYENMANSMSVAGDAAMATSDAMSKVHDSMHKAGGKSFSIEAMAKLDTDKIASGVQKVKSALMELSTLKIDGFLAMTTDGTSSSMVMGSEGLIKQISDGKLTVDVKMPDMKMPDINVKVFIGSTELQDIVRTEVAAAVGGAG